MEKGKGKFFVPNQGGLNPAGAFDGQRLDDSNPLWPEAGGSGPATIKQKETSAKLTKLGTGTPKEEKGGRPLW